MKILALDVGDKRVGIATSDELGVGIWPQKTFLRQGTPSDFEKLAEIIQEQNPQLVIVGLPLNMNGSEGPQAKKVRQFMAFLEKEISIPIEYSDERLTSWEAESRLVGQGVKGKRKKEEVDAMAASLILEDYLRSKGKL